MVFSSTIFLFMFLPITLIVYHVLDWKFKNYWLLVVSIVFFAWSQLNYLWIILLNIAINYIGGMATSWIKSKYLRKIVFIFVITAQLGILFYFKYFDFTITTINQIFNQSIPLTKIVLPIGISFFTFQGMSYAIDVYTHKVAAQKNILKVALYIVLFPQLIAGPIVRYIDVEKEINCRSVSRDDFVYGIDRFIIGLGKKVIIANTMASMVDQIWEAGVQQNTVAIAWLGSIAYTMQIYFDFSGYSDMAIGLGRMFGFHFLENFNLPYISKSISEFWRRWHISLSSWFRDYVYIPLGGNRRRVYLNLSIVFLLTGIWHGASWNFIIWGLWNGLFILIERAIKVKRNKLKSHENNFNDGNKKPKLKIVLLHIYTLFVVNTGWILFRADTIENAWHYFKTMFGSDLGSKPGFNVFWYLNEWTGFILILAIFFSTSLPSQIGEMVAKRMNPTMLTVLKRTALLIILLFAGMRMVSGTYNPFIYFQF